MVDMFIYRNPEDQEKDDAEQEFGQGSLETIEGGADKWGEGDASWTEGGNQTGDWGAAPVDNQQNWAETTSDWN